MNSNDTNKRKVEKKAHPSREHFSRSEKTERGHVVAAPFPDDKKKPKR